ncbi:MAG: SOS response-associated peptidase [Vulcanimicrobiaceae bacterium]
MCGRFSATDPVALMRRFPGFRFPAGLSPRYNVAPTQPILAVRNDGSNAVVSMRWGLVLAAGEPGVKPLSMINARAESLAERPAHRGLLKRQRCAIFADGFYEWCKTGSKSVPMYVRRRDGAPFAFAGLFEVGRDGALRDSATIVTCRANELVAPIHDRMPVILADAAMAEWLRPGELPVGAAEAILAPPDSQAMSAHAVSNAVNKASYDAPDCIAPATEPAQLELLGATESPPDRRRS